ncbi:MAG: hypothetical protein FWG47_00430 [Propionibacteriaceae bacterium]|nr:hypothetical protein [Propionibacteriaceae bacterium]
MREVLVDTSVWSEHFRKPQSPLTDMLANGLVVSHELIIAELALSMSAKHLNILNDIAGLGLLPTATLEEYLHFVTHFQIAGKRIGCVDTHLLVSCKLAEAALWTLDKSLTTAAHESHIEVLRIEASDCYC